jgi:pimeloyl-ACP methyl ester carboxylesterase
MLAKPPSPRLRRATAVPGVAVAVLGLVMGCTTTEGAATAPRPPGAGDVACTSLAAVALASHDVLTATSHVVAATPALPAYCQVNLDESPAISIRVGLPLNARDGGRGGTTDGAWNGTLLDIGNGGYAGAIPSIALALDRGDAGDSTDNGHSPAWCSAVNPGTRLPNSQPDCGEAGGGFVLDPKNQLLGSRVTDFIMASELDQTRWGLRFARAYYGQRVRWNYWVGMSTGGRQGWQMAQSYPGLFNGFVIGQPAMNWNTFLIAEAWPAVVVSQLLGPPGLPQTLSDAANAAALAACGTSGVIADPLDCHYNADALICKPAAPRPPTCLTPRQAEAINMIWDGPRDRAGGVLWGGIPRGTTFSVLLPGGSGMGTVIEAYVDNWLYQDPNYDWPAHLTIQDFTTAFYASYEKFQATASTDSADLTQLERSGAKVIFYHGTSDPLIVPFGSYNYIQRLYDRYGVARTRSFVQTFFLPGLGHQPPALTGSEPALDQLLDALQAWTQHGTAPESFTEVTASGEDLKVCAYPDKSLVTGFSHGSPLITCQHQDTVPAAQAAASLTAWDKYVDRH